MVKAIWKVDFSWCNSCYMLLLQSKNSHVMHTLTGSIN